MRNIRRLPFIFVSLINAVILLFISLLYIFSVQEEQAFFKNSLHSVDFLYIIVGLELILTLPCLIYYIGKREGEREGEREGGREGEGERHRERERGIVEERL